MQLCRNDVLNRADDNPGKICCSNRSAAGIRLESSALRDHAPDDIEGQESRAYAPDSCLFYIAFWICFVCVHGVANDVRHELHGRHDPEGYVGMQCPGRIRKAAEVLIKQHQAEQWRDDRGGRRDTHGHDAEHGTRHDARCLIADAADPHRPDIAEQACGQKTGSRRIRAPPAGTGSCPVRGWASLLRLPSRGTGLAGAGYRVPLR